MGKRIYLSSPHMSEEGFEMDFIKQAFATNWISPVGENIDAFEREVSTLVGSRAAAALSSGTAGIHMALKAAGVGEGDIVFCPTLTFAATANPIIYLNATPVFIDSDEETWNMSPAALEEAFQKYPQVKAVIVVHLYGLAADMDPIVDLCRKHQVVLIEDAAESLGSYYKGKHTGTIGDYGIFSFNGNKIITTSSGGMVVSDHVDKIEKIKFWASQSRDKARHYQHSEIGYNYRMSNVLAGIGRGQLKVLNDRVQRKTEIFHYYRSRLSDLNSIQFMPVNEWNKPNFWLSSMLLNGPVGPIEIIDALEKENIESRPLWKPMHLQPIFHRYDFIGTGVSERLFNTGICLPSDTKMREQDLDKVVKVIRSAIEEGAGER